MKKLRFPFYRQLDAMDCGPTCLRMIAKYYGKIYSLQTLRENSFITREGVSLLGISEAAETIGMRTLAVRASLDKLIDEVPLPCIAHWGQNHFVVVHKTGAKKLHVADPAHGLITYSREEFKKGWASYREGGKEEGFLLLMEPTPEFHKAEDEKGKRKTGMKYFFSYLRSYKQYIVQLFIGLFVGTLLGLIFPFLTQSLVDFGIANQNIGFVYTILIAQLMLFTGRISVDFLRSWILLHVTTRLNIAIIADFLIKLMKLPMPFFDTKMLGDLLQRIGDHKRIEKFLAATSLNTLFSLFNLVIYGAVLWIYSTSVFLLFAVGTVIYVAWIVLFLNKRRDLDYKQFAELSANQSTLIEMITGMQEIKLNNCEKQKRWEWEHIQAKLFKLSIKGLALSQYQQIGSFFVNELKNIIITFIVAKSVIDGHMTLGMMMAVQYIIGQLNAPVSQLLGLIQTAQDAKISLERLAEVHDKPDEEDAGDEKITFLQPAQSLHIENLAFQYEGPKSPFVLKDIHLTIPAQKVTAIVGVSGSGKTTLLKLLLKFYKPTRGMIRVGDIDLERVSARYWRSRCGVVMQDGLLFTDTIARNIALGESRIDRDKLLNAASIANILDVVEALPLGFQTRVGRDGHGLSQGQKQRILIARTIYKNPEYMFFDEATSSLDANNEHDIMAKLGEFYRGKTVVTIAHRLSTVKNADQIVVIEKGGIVERGTHAELTAKRGVYFQLVKNQLELGT